MHDQLRDMAYAIVRGEGRITRRSRVRGQDAGALLREQVCATMRMPSHALDSQI